MKSTAKYIISGVMAVGGSTLAMLGFKKVEEALNDLQWSAIDPLTSKSEMYEKSLDALYAGVKGTGMVAVGGVLVGSGIALSFISGADSVVEVLPKEPAPIETSVSITAESLAQAQEILDRLKGDAEIKS